MLYNNQVWNSQNEKEGEQAHLGPANHNAASGPMQLYSLRSKPEMELKGYFDYEMEIHFEQEMTAKTTINDNKCQMFIGSPLNKRPLV